MPPTAIKKADLTIVRLGLTIVTGFILLRRNNYPECSSEYKNLWRMGEFDSWSDACDELPDRRRGPLRRDLCA